MLKLDKKIVILIGNKSFIQLNLFNHLKKKYIVKMIKYSDISVSNISKANFIVNFSNSKNFYEKGYSKKNDRNLKIANIIKNSKTIFFLLSSRVVYSPKLNLSEKSKLAPINTYGQNCLKSEKYCKDKLKRRLVILRLSNVFGYEIGKKKKPSLVSIILKGVKKKKIIFDNNYYLIKDFLPIKLLCLYFEKLFLFNGEGIFNVGSGIPFPVNKFVNFIIDGKKVKTIIKNKKRFKDQNYCFNIHKIKKFTGIKINRVMLYEHFYNLKKKIKLND